MLRIPEKFEEIEFKTDKTEIIAGIISDTQTTAKISDLPNEIDDIFKGADHRHQNFGVGVNLIIHAGDVENPEFFKRLKNIAPVFAIKGNMDYGELKEELPVGILLKIFNWKIGIIHSPLSFWIGSHFNQVQEVVAEKLAKKEGFDILIFGHTHHPYLKEITSGKKSFLLFNPGSAMSPYVFSDRTSVGLLKITKNQFKGEIIPLKNKQT
jgi:hypothetical protein